MKTKRDLLELLTSMEIGKIRQRIRFDGFMKSEDITLRYNEAFIVSMGKYPQFINDYKHLVDTDTLEKCLTINPLTKLYLE
jgi:hypothetical protein